MPNVIEMNGRGYHLVWYIDQVAAALGWMVEAVSVFFAQTVQMLLTDSGAKGYQADISYAHRIAGLTRIPGTYNTAAHAYAGYRTLHKGRMDLLKAYDSIPPLGTTRCCPHGISCGEGGLRRYGKHREKADGCSTVP